MKARKKTLLLLFLAGFTWVRAADEGFAPLFNGTNLDGWVNINGAPETWSASNGVIHCTGFPTGAMRTERQYENFILEAEWRHLQAGGNSGIFIWGGPLPAPGVPYLRGIEVQMLDNGFAIKGKNDWYTTHGDIFPIHGATMKPLGRVSSRGDRAFPAEERSKSAPEWNHYRIVCTNGTIRLSVNGKEVSRGEDCNYRKGYLALESEGAPVEFRNVRLQELPPSGVPAEQTAPVAAAWRCLFNGIDLRGWNEAASGWKVAGGKLVADAPESGISTAPTFGVAAFIVDCRLAKGATNVPVLVFRGMEFPLTGAVAEKYHRFQLAVTATTATLARDGELVARKELSAGAPARSALEIRAQAADCFNIFAGER